MPPPRYTEASLVKELEKKSIGRPSTYAAIISTIQERGYVKVEQRRFFCLKMGEVVCDRLVENFDDLMDYGFTAAMEQDLDKIAEGKLEWLKVLDNFYQGFVKKLSLAENSMRENTPVSIAMKCKQCSRHLNLRVGRTGVFLSCSGYSLPPKERCKETINLIPGEEIETYSENEDEGNVAEIQAKKRCPKCDTAMDSYLIDSKNKLHVCGNSPDCDSYLIEEGSFRIKGYEGPTIQCDKCNDTMQLKTGRFGKYFACNSAPDCKNTRKLLKNGEAAPPKADPVHMKELSCEKSDGYFILRDGASGIFLASSKFPRSRETKKPQVADLVRHKDELDPKFAHLTKAPVKDPDGNPAIIRFSRKTKTHYIASEKDKKATKWKLFWKNNQWKKTEE
jgi:DNA topoisomerase-1